MRNKKLQDKIIKLKKKGLTQSEIARKLGMSRASVHYYLNRERCIKRAIEWFRKKPLEQRRIIYKKRNPYLVKYLRKRYWEDEEFREKQKKRARESGRRRYKLIKQSRGSCERRFNSFD